MNFFPFPKQSRFLNTRASELFICIYFTKKSSHLLRKALFCCVVYGFEEEKSGVGSINYAVRNNTETIKIKILGIAIFGNILN